MKTLHTTCWPIHLNVCQKVAAKYNNNNKNKEKEEEHEKKKKLYRRYVNCSVIHFTVYTSKSYT